MARVIVCGGSTVYGLHDPEGGGFAGRVKSTMMLRAANGIRPCPEVYAFGIPGRTLPDIVAALPNYIETYARGKTIGVFAVGASDHRIGRGESDPKVPLPAFRAALGELGELCAKYTISPVFLGFPRIDDRFTQPFHPTGENFNDKRLREYTECVRTFAESSEPPGYFVDMREPFDEAGDFALTAFDHLHPNHLGHALIADRVITVIDDIL